MPPLQPKSLPRLVAPFFSPSASRWLASLFWMLLLARVGAHPVPDLPVRSHFNTDGSAEIRVEVDPRCFSADPEQENYWQRDKFEELSPDEVRTLKEQGDRFVEQRLRFFFDPVGELKPAFQWSFEKLGDGFVPFETDDENLFKGAETVLVGSWKPTVVAGMTGYRIEARNLPAGVPGVPLNVMFLNFIGGQQVERYAVLFPGETSFTLDLTGLQSTKAATRTEGSVGVEASAGDWWSLFLSEIKRGFLHVVPLGLDHILFVLGLFLMARQWKPLVFQVSTFTVAHTLTLWLASAGVVKLAPSVVEPLIAASIVVIAVENIFHRKYTHWRLLVVFAFGLIHGLGFAGVMSTRLGTSHSLVVGLLGINIGVELGQLAVIALAIAATFPIPDAHYRSRVVIPGSILIALAGIWWVLDRTVL